MRNKFTNWSSVFIPFLLTLVLLIHSIYCFPKFCRSAPFFPIPFSVVMSLILIVRFIRHDLHSMLSSYNVLAKVFSNLHTVKFTFYGIQFYECWQMQRVVHLPPLNHEDLSSQNFPCTALSNRWPIFCSYGFAFSRKGES